MRDRLPLWVAVAAALTGTTMLASWFGKCWPATPWTVVPRVQLVAKGRQFEKQFGLNVNDWTPYEVPMVAKLLTHHANGVSGLSLRITFVPRHGGQAAEVGFNSAGFPIYWRAPNGYAPKYQSGSAKSAADAGFRSMAGAEAADYTGPIRSMGDDIREDEYVWEKPRLPHSDLRDEIKVVTKGSALESVERKVHIAGDEEGYWDVLGGIFGLLCTVGYIAILCIYLLWLARRAISHKFPIRVAMTTLLLLSTAVVAGIDWERRHSLSQHEGLPIFRLLFASATIFCFVAVARGISASARPKWISLEELCLLAPISKATGRSIAAGISFSPLLAAVPFLIAGCGLFPGASVLPHNVELLYSPAPLMDSLHIPTDIYLIAFFGFLVPALGRMIRFRWLRWLLDRKSVV